MNILALSGFNPANLSSWKISQYWPNVWTYDKRNWTKNDSVMVYQWIKRHYPSTPYIITAHSDAGALVHDLAHFDTYCFGLHCHACSFHKNLKQVRTKLPILLTYCPLDITTMGLATKRAYEFYKDNNCKVELQAVPRSGWHGHGYETCIPFVKDWLNNTVLK